jgi:hypothetical protein
MEKLDEKILEELQLELRWMPGVDPRNVAVKASVEAGVAILFGHVSDPSVRRVAEQVARRVLVVRSVVNEIKIHHPTSETEQELGNSDLSWKPSPPDNKVPTDSVGPFPQRNHHEKAHCVRPGRHPGPEQIFTR